MTRFSYAATAFVLVGSAMLQAEQQTDVPGQQTITARRARNPIVIDGKRGPAEWSGAIPLHVNANHPGLTPGIVPWQGQPFAFNPPANHDDLSYTIYTLYDDNNLYVAVDVADDRIIADNPEVPYLDDDVEIFINGDHQPFDMAAVSEIPTWFGVLPNNEGFQLITTAGNVRAISPPSFIEVNWDSKAGPRPRGYIVEARIALDSINTIDNSWYTNPNMVEPDFDNDPTQPSVPGSVFDPAFRRPQPGDSIRFNITVGDDDAGRLGPDPFNDSYNRSDTIPSPSSYLAWDGNSFDWWYADESAWGTLFLAP